LKDETKNYYMPLYFDDFVAGTYDMSSAARGVYIMLLVALAQGKRIQATIAALQRLGGDLTDLQFDEIMDKCRISADGFLINDKVDRVMAAIQSKRSNGRAGGLTETSKANLKQNTERTTERNLSGLPSEPPSEIPSILNPKSEILNPKAQSLNLKSEISDSLEPDRKSARRQVTGITWDAVSGFQNVTDSHLVKWKDAYPAVNVDQQLKAIDVWLIANPKKAHKSNWMRCIINWLSREQDRGGNLPSNKVQKPEFNNF
jgi:uncharacterized protein YdaU (DUF1376 family)